MGSWPAVYHGVPYGDTGTSYIRDREFYAMMEHHGTGTAWKFSGEWTTYMPRKQTSYKNLLRLGVMGEADFHRVMEELRAAGYVKPPTSMAEVFHAFFPLTRPRQAVIRRFRGKTFGGWQQAFLKGSYGGKVYHYDLRSAYRWAATTLGGLPNLATAFPTKDFTLPCAIYLVTNATVPGRSHPILVVTSEERDAYGLDNQPVRVLYGVGFRDPVDLQPAFTAMDAALPTVAKRASRSFWGVWNTEEAPVQVNIRSQAQRPLKAIFYNPIWAAFITSRVKMRCYVWCDIALNVFVDALLTKEPVPTGEGIGDWQLKAEYDSVWIKSAGVWGSHGYVVRHAGFADPSKVLRHEPQRV